MEDITEQRVHNRKRRLALIAGGYTRERELAVLSGDHVASLFDGDEQYQAYVIKLDTTGWFYTEPKSEHRYSVDKKDFSIILADGEKIKFDLALLLVVGPPGENGQLQGYLELVRMPYIGCGLLASGEYCTEKSICEVS
jgi:D-alanine-D-alanine ligase